MRTSYIEPLPLHSKVVFAILLLLVVLTYCGEKL
jgi:hypothetical protein